MKKQNRNYHVFIALTFLLAILAACGTAYSKTAITPISTKEVVLTPLKQTTNTPEPMEPTLAYWATAQEERLDTESTQVAETKQAILRLATTYPRMCGFQPEAVSISPDRNWIASDCKYDGDFFRVFQTHGDQVWDIPYSAIFEFYPEFLGNVQILYWSVDGNYLYFANRSCCADVDATTNGDALYKLNLDTGNWTLLIPGIFNYYTFSPEGRFLLYFLNNQAGVNDNIYLHLLDLDTGREEMIDIGRFELGWVIWKHDGQKIAVIAQTGNIYDDNRRFSLIQVDLQSKNLQTIILNTDDGLGIADWSDDDILTIRRWNTLDYSGYYVNTFDTIFYNLKDKEFVTLTSEP